MQLNQQSKNYNLRYLLQTEFVLHCTRTPPLFLQGVALVIGWNLILEYAIGTASVARAYSSYLDHLLGNVMSTAFKTYIPLNLGPHLSPYPDLCAFAITILLTIILR